MQSMKAHMDQMPVEERSAWESGEVGKWGVICGMMSRTRMVLKDAREAGRGIVSSFLEACVYCWGFGANWFRSYLIIT